jgi:hypothetical protein
MSSQASSPASPASITEEISTRTMSDVVKDFDTEELIEYLKEKRIQLKRNFKVKLVLQKDLQNLLRVSARSYETIPRLKLSTT